MPLRPFLPHGKFPKTARLAKSKKPCRQPLQTHKPRQTRKRLQLKDQIRRAAISIPSNIAEGDELDTDKQSIRHFYYAKGSTAELLTQSLISYEIGYIDKKTYEDIEKECKTISAMLMRLIQARRKP